jgi:histidinol dehydrogenase
VKILNYGSPEAAEWLAAFERARREDNSEARRAAGEIIDAVRHEGDAAVARFVKSFDQVELRPEEIAISPEADAQIDPALEEAIRTSIRRVEAFHSQQKQSGYVFEEGASRIEHTVRPLRRAGIYVPGGKAVYLSTLIMCAVPARIAGVREIVVATTPRAASQAALQFTARELGIETIYRSGGPAGIAAMAVGTESLRRVDKIVGPGNRYVTAAKQLLYGEVGLDMTAGPSEIVVLADDTADIAAVAADLRAQAEHGADSVPICITTSPGVADAVARATGDLERGAVIVANTWMDAARLSDEIAPEHLSIDAANSEELLGLVGNYGNAFVGSASAVALGDYIAGTNHVLPTGGSARFFSPLGVYDFYKRSNITRLAAGTAAAIAPAGRRIAEFEGLPEHARSIQIREVRP